MRNERQQDARVVNAPAQYLQRADTSRPCRVDVALGNGLDVHPDAIAGAEHVRRRAELDHIADWRTDRDGVVLGERVPGPNDVALRVATRLGGVDLPQAGPQLAVGDPRAGSV